MKTVAYAYFDPDGDHLVTITKGRFQCYRLDLTQTEPIAEMLWDQKLSNGFWIAFGRDVVIASNTSDKHVAVSKTTGEVVWERPRPKRDGISGRGIVVDHGGSECYVFTGYENVFQVSTSTGEDACAPWPIELWTSDLHDLGTDLVGVRVLPAAGQNHCSMAALDLHAQSLEIRCDFSADLVRPVVPAPDGSQCVGLRVDPTAEPTLEVLAVPSLKTHSTYRTRKDHLLANAAWSPGGRWIGVRSTDGCLLFDSNLEQVVEILDKTLGTPAFHPDEKHVVLPRHKTTKIERIEALFDEHAKAL